MIGLGLIRRYSGYGRLAIRVNRTYCPGGRDEHAMNLSDYVRSQPHCRFHGPGRRARCGADHGRYHDPARAESSACRRPQRTCRAICAPLAVPGPSNLGDFVRDPAMAIALGKALFWDMQVGSDGVQPSRCHFRAGADPRSIQQVSPGLKHMPEPDLTYTTGSGPNHQLTASDFPLTPPCRRRASAEAWIRHGQQRRRLVARHSSPRAVPSIRWAFRSSGVNTRRVEPRNTPSVINAVFNHRQFWDGRAENVFNGVNHLGERDPDARVFRADDPAQPLEVRVALAELQPRVAGRGADRQRHRDGGARPHAAGGRDARSPRDSASKGKRVAAVRPLAKQQVAATDSVLGTMSRWPPKRPRLQSLRPDDQGRVPRAVVAVAARSFA